MLRRLLGVKTADGKQAKVAKLAKNEVLMVNIGSTATGAKVLGVKADAAKLSLTSPACTEINEKIAISRRVDKVSSSVFRLGTSLTEAKALASDWMGQYCGVGFHSILYVIQTSKLIISL